MSVNRLTIKLLDILLIISVIFLMILMKNSSQVNAFKRAILEMYFSRNSFENVFFKGVILKMYFLREK